MVLCHADVMQHFSRHDLLRGGSTGQLKGLEGLDMPTEAIEPFGTPVEVLAGHGWNHQCHRESALEVRHQCCGRILRMFQPDVPPFMERALGVAQVTLQHPKAQMYLAVPHDIGVLALIHLIEVSGTREIAQVYTRFSNLEQGLTSMHTVRECFQELFHGCTGLLGAIHPHEGFAEVSQGIVAQFWIGSLRVFEVKNSFVVIAHLEGEISEEKGQTPLPLRAENVAAWGGIKLPQEIKGCLETRRLDQMQGLRQGTVSGWR
jgi:hypothetical protein